MATQALLIEPANEIPIPSFPFAQAAFGRDADTIIVQVDEPATNLFLIAVYFWPEVLGAFTFALVVWALLRWWRVARSPRLPGQPHCRRCGYCLTGLADDRCPECGTAPSVRPPFIGRSLAQRVGPLLAIAGVAAIAYGSLWAFQVPRVGWVNRLVSIWSTEWYDAAEQRNATFLDRLILKYSGPTTRLAEYDATSGKQRRVIMRRTGGGAGSFLAVSKTGEEVWTAVAHNKLAVISLADGQVICEFDLPAPVSTRSGWNQIAGFRRDGSGAVAAIHDTLRNKVAVVSADRSTGQAAVLFETDTIPANGPTRPEPITGRFFLVPGEQRLRLIETRDASTPIPDRPNSFRMSARVILHEMHGDTWTSREFPPCFSVQRTPAFTPDGRFMFLDATFESGGPVRWDLDSLEPVGYRRVTITIPAGSGLEPGDRTHYVRDGGSRPTGGSIVSGLVYCQVRDHLYAAIHAGSSARQLHLGVFSAATLERLDVCPASDDYAHPNELQLSPDGRRLMIETLGRIQGGKFENRLILFDLR